MGGSSRENDNIQIFHLFYCYLNTRDNQNTVTGVTFDLIRNKIQEC